MSQMHTFTMTEQQARMIHALADSECKTIKSWITRAVERGDLVRAQIYARDLREYEALLAAFNMDAKHTIADAKNEPVETIHLVRPAR